MGTIPLPALDIKTPQQPDLLQKYSNLQQLRASQQQLAMQRQEAPLRMQSLQQQTQLGAGQVQQQQIQLNDQKAMTAAMQSWDGKDYTQLPALVIKNGGSATAVMGLKQKILDQQTAISTQVKNQGQGALAQIEATNKRNDLVAGALSPLVDSSQVPDAQLPQALTSTVQSLVQQGALDQQHADAAKQILQSGNPVAIRQGIDHFRKTLMAQSQITDDALKAAQTAKAAADAKNAAGKIDPSSPLYDPSQSSIALGTAPGAAQIQTNAVQQAGRRAAAEESARMPGEMALAAQRQALSQGDPKMAAQLLINGDATLSELRARGVTPDFIARTLFEARRASGGKYNAQAADAQYNVARSEDNVKFFGSANSLIDPGGTLDQLQQAGNNIPHGQLPALNTLADWQKLATGNGPLAHYAATALGVADDYSKVMGGGQGSDSSRLQALNLIKANASEEGRGGAVTGIRDAVVSQTKSRIGNNPVLGRMYGSPALSGGGSGMVTVQIPGSPAGQIPTAALAKFKQDHPNAQVQQ
jgi:hypothetical protein